MTQEQKNEIKIQTEMKDILRSQAINNLKTRGEL